MYRNDVKQGDLNKCSEYTYQDTDQTYC